MKPASLHLLKNELSAMPQKELVQFCLRLARYKVENKELLSYLIFEAADETAYVNSVKNEIVLAFSEINTNHSYYVRKSIRKILRNMNKYVRFCGSKQAEAELRLSFCRIMKDSGLLLPGVTSLNNIYAGQLSKVRSVLPVLHEDLRHDYLEEIRAL